MLTADQLRLYPLFAGLTVDELSRLALSLSKRTVAKGAYLYYPGNPGLYTYLVEAGLIRLFFTNANGEEFLLNLVGPRETFGLPLLLDDQLRVMGAAARQTSVVLVISREDLFHWMECFPTLMRNVYLDLSISARKLILNTRSLVTISLRGRLANMLLRLGAKGKDQGKDSDKIILPLTQTEIAGWLNASRGRLNRAMKELQQLGLIRVDGQRIFILDREGLQRMTEDIVLDRV